MQRCDLKKITDASFIRDIAAEFCPDISSIIYHDSEITASTWSSGIETGKAVEFLTLCALIVETRSAGHDVLFPSIYAVNPDLFYLRNIIPRHHGAQAGHDVVIGEDIPLLDRFVSALTPKAIIKSVSGKIFLIYREGHPIHFMSCLVNKNIEYFDRPDILISEGEIELNTKGITELQFEYKYPTGNIFGALRVRNDIKTPLISFKITGEVEIPINGIIECSVGKGRVRAEEQLLTYLQIYTSTIRPLTLLINGRVKPCPAYEHNVLIELNTKDLGHLSQQLRLGINKLVTKLYL